MLNLVWLRSLMSVVRYKGFQSAAQSLGLSQPTISQHIQRLEEDLGVTLITRSRRECEPTPAAEALLPYAESLLRLAGQAREAVVRNVLRVGSSSNVGIYLLQPYLRSYGDEAGGRPYELVIDRNPTIAERLHRGEIDVAVMEWADPTDQFQSVVWRQEPLVLIVPPDHRLANQQGITREQLSELTLLGGEPGTGTGRLLSTYFADSHRMPSVSMQLGSTEAVKQAVKAGLGVSLVMASAVETEVRTGSLRAIPMLGPGLNKEIFLSWRVSSSNVRPLPEFVEHLMGGVTY